MGSYRPVLLGVVVFELGVAGGGAASAGTIRVPADQPTIQFAIDATVDGDVVVVAKGTYKENIDFRGKAITVRSTNPTEPAVAASTIIDGNQAGAVVTFDEAEKATSVLSGFTLTNGTGWAYGGFWLAGGGVYCAGSSPQVTNNIISGNGRVGHVYGGGVVCMGGSSPTLTGNSITWNTGGCGGGVYCVDSSPKLTDNIISNNVAQVGGFGSLGGQGGGVFCKHSSPTLTNNLIHSNHSDDDGGGVRCEAGSSPTLTGNIIAGNSTDGSGGGIYCYDNSSPALRSNIISGNKAVDSGGGIECNTQSSPALANNIICYNSVSNGYGGGVCCYYLCSPTLTNNTIVGNSANFGGGVSAAADSSPALKNSIVAFNPKGGGLYVYTGEGACTPVITYCDLYANAGGDYINWPNMTGLQGNISKNPLFASLTAGDFHERSKGGRWDPNKGWVKDTVQSPCVDSGAPSSAFGKEPTPNGGRINMGAYGNTSKASKAPPTVAAAGVVLTATADATGSGACQITLSLSAPASAQVSVLNVAGRAVAALPLQDLPQGVSALVWDGKSAGGTRAPAGRYVIRVSARTEGGAQTSALATVVLR